MPSRRTAFILSLSLTLMAPVAAPLAPAAMAVPAGSAFTYQGRIDKSGSPANGAYNLQFMLWDDLAAGAQVGATQTVNGVAVANGLFTVSLDFGSAAFDGNARWLQIAVQGPGDLGFTALAPRQAITAAPYAIRALTGGGGGGFSLPFTGSTSTPSGSAFEVENTGTNGYGITARGQSWGGWFQSTGSTGGYGMIAYGGTNGAWASGTDVGVYGESFTGFGTEGFYGFGVFIPTGDKAGVYGHTSSSNAISAGVRGRASVSRGVEGISATGPGVYGTSNSSWGVYGTTSGSGAAGVHGYASGAGIGVLGISQGNDGIVASSNAAGKSGIWGNSTSPSGYGGAFSNSGGGVALLVSGLAQVNTLQIMGGADLAERFASQGQAEPGTVMVIDPDAPGHMKISDQAYCRRVAGVVSGANALKAGVVLSEDGATEGTLPIALTGRVWVRCDATRAPIRPGDLLTTADRAGLAMVARDPARASGAILGKAMTALERGTGMVLVLVSLQ
jgi:hypothetical protein